MISSTKDRIEFAKHVSPTRGDALLFIAMILGAIALIWFI